MACIQLLFMLSFAFVVFFSGSATISTPDFSLVKTRTFDQERFTERGIPFYISRGIDENKLPSLEPQIESAWLSRISRLCAEEKNDREAFIVRTNYFAKQRREEALESLKTQRLHNCDLLETFQRTRKL